VTGISLIESSLMNGVSAHSSHSNLGDAEIRVKHLTVRLSLEKQRDSGWRHVLTALNFQAAGQPFLTRILRMSVQI
jgi:hypothetical protein